MTSALDGGEWSASCPSRTLPPGKGHLVPIAQEAGWAPEPVWTQRLEEKSFASAGNRTPIARSIVRHYTDWATPAPYILQQTQKNYKQSTLVNIFKKLWVFCVVILFLANTISIFVSFPHKKFPLWELFRNRSFEKRLNRVLLLDTWFSCSYTVINIFLG
jgi:hypothetical protein